MENYMKTNDKTSVNGSESGRRNRQHRQMEGVDLRSREKSCGSSSPWYSSDQQASSKSVNEIQGREHVLGVAKPRKK
jgi:hypothetical protein